VTSFKDLGLAEPLLRAIQEEGHAEPTPIQAKALPLIKNGRDVIGIAQTGTGKTAAFVLPLLHDLVTQPQKIRAQKLPAQKLLAKSCQALILVPTRELAAQIEEKVRDYGRHVRHSRAVVVGGVKPGPQVRSLARGVDILIATPGRLEDHVSTGALRLDRVQSVVLDEADQMLDLGFLPAIRRIMSKLPAERQTILLSATMPKQVRTLAHDFLRKPAEVSVGPTSRPIEKIEQTLIPVSSGQKRSVLVDLFKNKETNFEKSIVFTRTKRGANKVCQFLEKAKLRAAAIHGNKSQVQRQKALADFKKGRIGILVATDIAARGIDIDDVSHVVNFDMPNTPEAYVHRIGRTARAGKFGTAISLCDGSERKLLRDIEKLIGGQIQRVSSEEGVWEPEETKPKSRSRPGRPGPRSRRKSDGGKGQSKKKAGWRPDQSPTQSSKKKKRFKKRSKANPQTATAAPA